MTMTPSGLSIDTNSEHTSSVPTDNQIDQGIPRVTVPVPLPATPSQATSSSPTKQGTNQLAHSQELSQAAKDALAGALGIPAAAQA